MQKKILGFSNYNVDEYGNVYSQNGKKLCQWTDNMGYRQVVLYKNKKRHYKRVHRLVYEAFNGAIEKGLIINHIDENKDNNSLYNLEAITTSENIKYFYERNNVTKVEYDVSVYDKATGNFIKRYNSLRALCEELKLNRKTVTNIIKGNKKTNNYPYTFVRN